MSRIIALPFMICCWLLAIVCPFGVHAQPQNKPVGPVVLNPSVTIPAAYPANIKLNYIRTWEAKGPITNPNAMMTASNQQVGLCTEYFDGPSRILQSVDRQATSQAKDLVTPHAYDQYGRETKEYLQYVSTETSGQFKLNPFNEQYTYMQGQYPGEKIFYSEKDQELSPLGRTLKTFAPGNSWGGNNKPSVTEYLINQQSENVVIWDITNDSITFTANDININIPTTSGSVYGTGKLTKGVTKDENGNATVEYKDKEGNVVLKKVQAGAVPADYSGYTNFLCTYYVYDDLNRLRFIIPPAAVEEIKTTWVLTPDIINERCFRYEYDLRNREVAKKAPGAGWMYMVFDMRDRQVFMQDGRLRNVGQWMTTLYDGLNRTVMTGVLHYPNGAVMLQSYVNTVTAQQTTIDNIVVHKNPIPANYQFIPITKTFYDNYDWTVITFDPAYNNLLDAGNNQNAVPLPAQNYKFVKGHVTGSMLKVITDPDNLLAGNWLTTVNFYDDRLRIIQTRVEHFKGVNTVTNRYNFADKVICSYLHHTVPGGMPSSVRIKTNLEFDHAGSLVEVWKTINDDPLKKALIVKNEYNELGNLARRTLGYKKNSNGDFTTDPLEILNFSYNVRDWLTGINRNYAIGAPTGAETPWFGVELNYDQGFQVPQLNSNLAGIKWRSRGDDIQRAYGYLYDNSDRLLGADFTQYNGSAYDNDPVVKFDMELGNGQLPAYDANGNIQAMRQWGLKLNASPIIDDMVYSYHSNSNKLRSISEQGSGVTVHKLGDFTDNNTIGDDYGYDVAGNVVTDKNKRMNGALGLNVTSGGGINYNFLNQPWKIIIKDANDVEKGRIIYQYDASGSLLKKVVEDKSVTGKVVTVTTSYAGGFIYESKTIQNPGPKDLPDYTDVLQYTGHEQGRIRYIPAEGPIAAHYEFDFNIRDHVDNVRMVLTSEQKMDPYQAGMEMAARTRELELFGDKITSTEHDKPAGFDNDGANAKVIMVNGGTADRRVGPGVVLKVMTGDKIMARTNAWYHPTTTDHTTDPILPAIVETLLSQLTPGVSYVGKGTAAQQVANGVLQPGMENYLNNMTLDAGRPKAYLNWVLLDEEQYKNVSASSGFEQIKKISGTEIRKLVEANNGNPIEMTRNGYLYVYVSNESKGDVFFDDLRVEHIRGPLMEETHYYPFGLTMAAISSRASLRLENKYKFNKKEFHHQELADGSGLDWYNFGFREYDPQINRFLRIDPLADKTPDLTTYHYAANNPASNIDLDGLSSVAMNHVWREAGFSQSGGKVYYNPNSVMGKYYNRQAFIDGARAGVFLGLTLVDGAGMVGRVGSRGMMAAARTASYENARLQGAVAAARAEKLASARAMQMSMAYRPAVFSRGSTLEAAFSAGRGGFPAASHAPMRYSSHSAALGGRAMPGGVGAQMGRKSFTSSNVGRFGASSSNMLESVGYKRGVINSPYTPKPVPSLSGLKIHSVSPQVYVPHKPFEQIKVKGVDIPLPDKAAMGYAHTTMGYRLGGQKNGMGGYIYRQSATFTGGGNPWPALPNGVGTNVVPWSRVDWTTHDLRYPHPYPHQHVYYYDRQHKHWDLVKPHVPFVGH